MPATYNFDLTGKVAVVTGAGGGPGWIFWDNFPKVSQKRTLSARRAKACKGEF